MTDAGRVVLQAERLIKQWGGQVAVRRGEEERSVWAVIQPIDSRNRQYQEAYATYAGLADRGFAKMYLSGGEEPPGEGDVVEQAGKRYLTLRGERMTAQDKTVYCWAVLMGAPEER